jgi:hypothetical protein
MASVTEIIESAQTYANTIAGQVEGLTNDILQLANFSVENLPTTIQAAPAYIDVVNEDYSALVGDVPVAPVLSLPTLNAPAAPTPEIDTVDNVAVPSFTAPVPDVNVPAAPTFTLPSRPGEMPAFNAPNIPTMPAFSLPAAPTLQNITLPSAPTVEFPDFIATAPSGEIAAPSSTFSWAEGAYSSALMDATKAKLLTDLENGGYGIDVNDEQQIWDRGADREEMVSQAATEEVKRDFGRMGYSLPQPWMQQAIEKAKQTGQDNQVTFSREVAVKRADLFVQNRQFTIQAATAIESLLVNFHISRMERMLNAAKYAADVVIAFYNAQLEKRRLDLQQYQTLAEVYRTRIQAQVERLNAYRAELEAARTVAEIDKAKVDNYRAQLAGVEALVAIYSTSMKAAEIQAQIEKLKQESYAEMIRGFLAEVQAKEAEFRAFVATIQGEEAKVRLYESQARAYSSVIEGIRTSVQAKGLRVTSQVEKARAQIEVFNGQNRQYETNLRYSLEAQGLSVRTYDAQVSAYRAKSDATGELARVGISNYSANVQTYLGTLRYNVDRAQYELTRITEPTKLRENILKDGLNVKVQQVQSALSAINAVASQSTSE